MEDSYVCSGAMMKCTMGTTPARLTVLPIRTVFLTGQPMANISDHQTMVNLAPFGLCRSLGFPATASATAAALGTLTPMPCMHNTPFPWMGGKNDYIVKGEPALLKSSTCSCMWGGTISITDDGQTSTGPADMSREPAVDFPNDPMKAVSTGSTPPIPPIGVNGLSCSWYDGDRYNQRKQKHCKKVLAKMEERKTNVAYLFWTNGGGDYAADLRDEIQINSDGKEIIVQKLEETEMGKAMVSIVNDVISAVSGKEVESMTWEQKKEVFDSLEEAKRIEIENFQNSVSAEYAEEAALSRKNENAAIFLVVGTNRREDGSIRVNPERTWRKAEKPVLRCFGYSIDGLLLNGGV